jgi:hypothetical protein
MKRLPKHLFTNNFVYWVIFVTHAAGRLPHRTFSTNFAYEHVRELPITAPTHNADLLECNTKISISYITGFYSKCRTNTTHQDIWPHCIAALEAKTSKVLSTKKDSYSIVMYQSLQKKEEAENLTRECWWTLVLRSHTTGLSWNEMPSCMFVSLSKDEQVPWDLNPLRIG